MAAQLAIVNGGGWGTALAVLLARAGHEVRLWCRRQELVDQIAASHQNAVYLPDVDIPTNVRPTTDLAEVVAGADAVLLVPISRAARTTARAVAQHLAPGTPVLHATKGLEVPSLLRLSEVVAAELGQPPERIAVLFRTDARRGGRPRVPKRDGRRLW